MNFIDTHTHLDDEAFDSDLDEVIERSRDQGVTRWINVGYNEERWKSTRDLVRRIPDMSAMVGLHPGDADAWTDGTRSSLLRAIQEVEPVAIGEIGIDLYWRQNNLGVQENAFREQLQIAIEHDLPAVIHMRSADGSLLNVLNTMNRLPRIHFHSFDGGEELQAWVLRNDATVGVGGLVTRKGSESLQDWIRHVPRDIVVLETDSPYLKPRGIRGKRNEPAYMPKVAEFLGTLWNADVDSVATTTTANAVRIFSLPESFSP